MHPIDRECRQCGAVPPIPLALSSKGSFKHYVCVAPRACAKRKMRRRKRLANLEPDYTVSPGEFLAEVLADKGMTAADLVEGSKLNFETVAGIIVNGNEITEEIAVELERVLFIPTALWRNLQRHYDADRKRLGHA